MGGAPPVRVSKFRRLAITHAAMMGGDAAMLVALADSLFLSIDLSAARSRVLLFLVVSFAPFVVLAPLIGPFIDRVAGGRRFVIQIVALARVVISLWMATAIDSLVLVDVAPRIEADGVRRIVDFMTARPEGFATLEEAALHVARYKGAERSGPGRLEGLRKNLRRNAAGRWVWHWDPKLLESWRPGRQDDEQREASIRRRLEAAAAIEVPMMLIRGRMSDVVSEENARELLAIAPHTEYVDLAGAAHMVAGDRNDAFTHAVLDFIRRVLPADAA